MDPSTAARTPSGDPGTSQKKISAVQGQVTEVTNVLQENINKIVERGQRLDQLEDRSEMLSSRSEDFRVTSRRMARRVWWANMRVNLIIGGVIVGVLVLIYFLAR
ncbi:uncharacterized protein LOC141852729 isoform X2 [Brevipalpus obovatus]|uniref:uncharacterized protein LOC141852729 isoform X2 n=1 Tax=Brevipalpus obovatus TaxID=246614 RepID=UPI003D9F5DF3